jgi:hypothetical protein
MNPEQITTIILNILASGGVTIFLLFVIQGLRREIKNLNIAIETQNDTFEVIGKRITEKRFSEIEKVGNIYKSLIDELPVAIDQYSEIIRKTKENVIEELERANQSKDERLKRVAELRLKEIEVVQPIITQLSTLSENLHQTMNEVRAQLHSLENISHMAPTLDLGTMWSRLKAHERSGLASNLSLILSGGPKSVTEPTRFSHTVIESGVRDYEAKIASPTDKSEEERKDK